MAKQVLSNGDTGLVFRGKLNDNYTELYDSKTSIETQLAGLSQLYKYRNVRVSSTANIVIGSFNIATPVDGVTLVIGDRILLRHQSTASQNGIYVVNSSSGLSRADDGNAWNEYPGSLVSVNEGTTNADTRWFCTSNDGGTLESTSITYTDATSGSGVPDGDKGDIAVSSSGTVWTVEKGLAHVFASFFDVTGVKAGDIVTIIGDKSYRATGPSSFEPLVANPTSHTHPAYLTEPLVMPATAMAALAIDYTKFLNTKTITGNATMTFVAGTPTSWIRTDLIVHNNVGTASILTIPSCYSYARNALITSVVLPANSYLSLSFVYTGTRWEVYGDPVATSGTVGKYLLLDDSVAPTEGQVPKWDNTLSKWVPGTNASGSASIRSVQLGVFGFTTDVAVGDGASYFFIPVSLNGMNLTSCHAYVITAGITGTTNIQISRTRGGTTVSMLSTVMTIDSTETGTNTALDPYSINTANDDVATHDRIRVDVPAVSTTAPKGLVVILNFETP